MMRTSILAAITAGLILSGCSQGGTTSQSMYPSRISQSSSNIVPKARSSADSVIYVVNGPYRVSGSVGVLDTKTLKVVNTITNGVGFSVALAVDSSENLYVANRKGSTVTVYAPNTSVPALTIKQDIVKPHGLQFDPAGDLNVLNVSDVTVYAPGTGTLLRKEANKLTFVLAMTFDPVGDLFVLNTNNKTKETYIVEYAAGSTKVLRTFSDGSRFAYATDLIIGPDGYLYIAANTSVIVFDPATGSIVRSITTGVYDAIRLAFDSVGNLYVANNGTSKGPISVYAPGASTPSYEIDEDGLYGNALLFDQNNDLYVVSPGKIVEFAPGESSPKRSIKNNLAYPWAAVFGQ